MPFTERHECVSEGCQTMISAKDPHLKCARCRNIAKANRCAEGCGNRVWREGGRCTACHRPGRITRQGYTMLYQPDNPRSQSNGYVYEHITVMESMLGRRLVEGENVHHKNGVRNDNRPETLELWSRSQPFGARVDDRIADAIRVLRLYRPDLLVDSRELSA